MNYDSTNLLQKHGLPMTEIFNLKEFAACKQRLQNEFFVYIRYSTTSKQQHGFTNLVLDKSSLFGNLDKFIDHVEQGFIVSVERKYTTLVGGATLYFEGYTYTEIVKGHSVTLLRRGLCGARIVLHKDGNVAIRKHFQRFLAEQHNNYLYSPTAGPSDTEIAAVISEIGKYMNTGEPGLLIEWMLTDESGFLCCDAKTGFSQFGKHLCNLSNSDSINVFDGSSESHKDEKVIVGDFDCDLSSPLENFNYLLVVNGEALLSHCITNAFLAGNCDAVLKYTNSQEK